MELLWTRRRRTASTQTPSGQFRPGLIVSSSLLLLGAMASPVMSGRSNNSSLIMEWVKVLPGNGAFQVLWLGMSLCASCFSLYAGVVINQNCWNVMLTHSDLSSNIRRLFNEEDPMENKRLPGKIWIRVFNIKSRRLGCFIDLSLPLLHALAYHMY